MPLFLNNSALFATAMLLSYPVLDKIKVLTVFCFSGDFFVF